MPVNSCGELLSEECRFKSPLILLDNGSRMKGMMMLETEEFHLRYKRKRILLGAGLFLK